MKTTNLTLREAQIAFAQGLTVLRDEEEGKMTFLPIVNGSYSVQVHRDHDTIMAYLDGAEVEYCADGGDWKPCTSPIFANNCRYRIKPEATYGMGDRFLSEDGTETYMLVAVAVGRLTLIELESGKRMSNVDIETDTGKDIPLEAINAIAAEKMQPVTK